MAAQRGTISKRDRDIGLIQEACISSGMQTNGYANHVFVRLRDGEREHGVDSYREKDVFKELLDEAADLAGWSLLEYNTLEELKQSGVKDNRLYFLQEILKQCMKRAAQAHTELAQAQKLKEELERDVIAGAEGARPTAA